MHTEQLGNAQPQGVAAEGTQFDKQRKATEMLTDGYVSFAILDYWRGNPKWRV